MITHQKWGCRPHSRRNGAPRRPVTAHPSPSRSAGGRDRGPSLRLWGQHSPRPTLPGPAGLSWLGHRRGCIGARGLVAESCRRVRPDRPSPRCLQCGCRSEGRGLGGVSFLWASLTRMLSKGRCPRPLEDPHVNRASWQSAGQSLVSLEVSRGSRWLKIHRQRGKQPSVDEADERRPRATCSRPGTSHSCGGGRGAPPESGPFNLSPIENWVKMLLSVVGDSIRFLL